MKTLLAVLLLAAMSVGQTVCNSTSNVAGSSTSCRNTETNRTDTTKCEANSDGGVSCNSEYYYGEGFSAREYRACSKAIKGLKKYKGQTAEIAYQNDVNKACAGMHKADKWIKPEASLTLAQ
jgi:hypothetical protein